MDLGEETDCAICFEEMEGASDLYECAQCKKHFHHQCIMAWKKSDHTTCPLCRHEFNEGQLTKKREAIDLIVDDLEGDDPLRRLTEVHLL